ncbi:MAG TPA: AI-2E family transporter [Usitatibacter sp.]|jgi:predicted PurR-regulated permease PerM|nr:AI-2E family transporter [Usitatibacter sp.]
MHGISPASLIAIAAVVFLLKTGEEFFVPLFVSLLISYALAPVVEQLTRLVRLRVIAAAIVVLAILAGAGFAAWAWSDDVAAIWQKVPVAARTVSKNVQQMVKPAGPINEVKKAAADIESAAATGKPAPSQQAAPRPEPSQQMSIWQLAWTGWKGMTVAATQVTVVFFLVFFMLASGNLFKKKLVLLSGDRLAQRKFTVQVIDEIDQQVRRYLLVMLLANTLVGLGTWGVFALNGLEYAGLWGLVAAVLHTIPYFGPALIAIGSFIVALVQFGEWQRALVVAASSIAVATLVGTLFATWLASRETRMNTTASFVGLLFFGWIWGLWGLLLGIPILAIVKTVCDHNEDWKVVGELLGR